jgi:hypothetical protein
MRRRCFGWLAASTISGITFVPASALLGMAVPLTFGAHLFVLLFVFGVLRIAHLGVLAGAAVIRLALKSVVALLAVCAMPFLRSIVAIILCD